MPDNWQEWWLDAGDLDDQVYPREAGPETVIRNGGRPDSPDWYPQTPVAWPRKLGWWAARRARYEVRHTKAMFVCHMAESVLSFIAFAEGKITASEIKDTEEVKRIFETEHGAPMAEGFRENMTSLESGAKLTAAESLEKLITLLKITKGAWLYSESVAFAETKGLELRRVNVIPWLEVVQGDFDDEEGEDDYDEDCDE